MPDTKKESNAKYNAKLKKDPIRFRKHLDYKNKWVNNKRENSPEFKKKEIIHKWKSRGIIDEDFNSVYEMFINQTNCWICDKQFKPKGDRCLDHDHFIDDAPNVRFVCCRDCNWHILREY